MAKQRFGAELHLNAFSSVTEIRHIIASRRKKAAALFAWKGAAAVIQTSRRLRLDASLRDERRSGVLLH